MSLNYTEDMDVLNKFRSFLHHKGLRVTPERMAIARDVLLSDSHFNADDLYLRMYGKNQKISRATVYRTLELLVASGLVRKTVFNTHSASFEKYVDKPDHGHFICMTCGKITEFYDQRIQDLHRNLEKVFAFTIINYTHQIYGKCNHCKDRND